MLERFQAGDDLQIGVGVVFAVGEREAFERFEILDDRERGGRIDALAELEIFEREIHEGLEGFRGGFRRAEFEAFEFGELAEVQRGGVGEFCVGEAEGFVIGKGFAEGLKAGVINLAAAKTGALELRPAVEIRERPAGRGGADVGEADELFEAGEVGEAEVVELGLVDDRDVRERVQIRERREPVVLRGGVKNLQRLQLGMRPRCS